MLGDHVEKEDFTAKVHVALWPKNDTDTFETILNEHPEVIESKFGRCKDTLLMRFDLYPVCREIGMGFSHMSGTATNVGKKIPHESRMVQF